MSSSRHNQIETPPEWVGWLLFGALLASVLTQSQLVPGRLGSVLVIGMYGVLGLATLWVLSFHGWFDWLRQDPPPRYATVAIAVIGALYVVHILGGNYQSPTNIVSGIAAIVIVSMNLFVLPRIIPLKWFLGVTAAVSALLVVVTIPLWFSAFVLPSLAPTVHYGTTATVSYNGWELSHLLSITENPNILARILFVGFIASLVRFQSSRDSFFAVLAGVNGIGLFWTQSRMTWAATLLAAGLLIAYRVGGRRLLIGAVGSAIVALASLLSVVVWLYSGGAEYVFSARPLLWDAATQAIAERPIIGHGLGDSAEMIAPYYESERFAGDSVHNSYLRMGLIGGLIGLTAYVSVVVGSLIDYLRRPEVNPGLVALAVGFLAIQLMESHMIVGYEAPSVLNALVVGYLVTEGVAGTSG